MQLRRVIYSFLLWGQGMSTSCPPCKQIHTQQHQKQQQQRVTWYLPLFLLCWCQREHDGQFQSSSSGLGYDVSLSVWRLWLINYRVSHISPLVNLEVYSKANVTCSQRHLPIGNLHWNHIARLLWCSLDRVLPACSIRFYRSQCVNCFCFVFVMEKVLPILCFFFVFAVVRLESDDQTSRVLYYLLDIVSSDFLVLFSFSLFFFWALTFSCRVLWWRFKVACTPTRDAPISWSMVDTIMSLSHFVFDFLYALLNERYKRNCMQYSETVAKGTSYYLRWGREGNDKSQLRARLSGRKWPECRTQIKTFIL